MLQDSDSVKNHVKTAEIFPKWLFSPCGSKFRRKRHPCARIMECRAWKRTAQNSFELKNYFQFRTWFCQFGEYSDFFWRRGRPDKAAVARQDVNDNFGLTWWYDLSIRDNSRSGSGKLEIHHWYRFIEGNTGVWRPLLGNNCNLEECLKEGEKREMKWKCCERGGLCSSDLCASFCCVMNVSVSLYDSCMIGFFLHRENILYVVLLLYVFFFVINFVIEFVGFYLVWRFSEMSE